VPTTPTDDATARSGAPWRRPPRSEDTSIGEVVEYVKAYALQETVGPLRGAGRWLAFGAAGALALSVGLVFLLLALLRFLQYEFRQWLGGSWTWLAYLVVLVVTIVLLVITVSRIRKSALYDEPS
jgi:hypothetical protein